MALPAPDQELVRIDDAHDKIRENKVMSDLLPVIYLARHGETAWSLTGQHTGLTDLPLTERGEENARALGERLTGLKFAKVFTSPLQRATRTCELAGFGAVAEVDRNLLEWNYGQYEGLTTAQIHAERPDWQLFRDGCPGGESPEQVGARADCSAGPGARPLERTCCFFRAAIFCGCSRPAGWRLQTAAGRYLLLSTASLSALGYENNLSAAGDPAVE